MKKSRDTPSLILTITSVALLTVSALICLNALGPHGEPKPSVTDWISAMGQALGALLTGGALIYAARTYEKQRHDRHEESLEKRRAQASAVTLVMTREKIEHKWDSVIRNDSALPIFSMNIVSVDNTGKPTQRHFLNPVVRGQGGTHQEKLFVSSTEEDSFVEFKDAANVAWKRYGDGRLVEDDLSPGNRN